MQTVIFYDVKEYEKKYFDDELEGKFHIIYRDSLLTSERILDTDEENAEIICIFTLTCLSKDIIKKYKNLKLILTRSVGYSHIDTDYCNEVGIIVANTPHYGDYTVAEYSFGILLNLVRRICYGVNELKNGDMYPETFGMELYNKTIGIIGTGAIGSKSVKIANGFSMNILCYDITQNSELIEKYGVKYVSLDTLCKLSDIVLLQAPLTVETYHLINKEKLMLMSENTVIVNTARGELIDTEALYEILLENRIKGVALDVLEFEETISEKRPGANINMKNLRISLINNKLLNLKNVIATPHIAYDTKEAVSRILETTVKNLLEYNDNKILQNRVY